MMAGLTERQREYREVYLRSWHWRQMRRLALDDAEGRCAVCNSPKDLDVHHRTYERLGHERLTDLLVLCRKCHDLFHGSRHVSGRKGKKRKKHGSPTHLKKNVAALAAENELLHARQEHNRTNRERRARQAASFERPPVRDWREERQLPRKSR